MTAHSKTPERQVTACQGECLDIIMSLHVHLARISKRAAVQSCPRYGLLSPPFLPPPETASAGGTPLPNKPRPPLYSTAHHTSPCPCLIAMSTKHSPLLLGLTSAMHDPSADLVSVQVPCRLTVLLERMPALA